MHPLQLFFAAACTQVLYLVISAAISPTRHIPGPFLARFTRLWYFLSVWSGQHEKQAFALHRRYAKDGQYLAPIVRLGPNLYSIAEPDKQIYGHRSKMPKSSWYKGWQHPDPDKWTPFTDRNIQRHADTRKKFQGLYSLSSILGYEKYVDECVTIFDDRLNEMAESGEVVDIFSWFGSFAWDVIGDVTYSKRFGFLDAGEDVQGIRQAIDAWAPYATLVGIYSWLHPYLFGIMQNLPGSGAAGRAYVAKYAMTNKTNREAERGAQDVEVKGTAEKEESMPRDFLDRLLDMKDENQKGVTDYDCIILGTSNITAGGETTALALSGILYALIKNPRAMEKLRAEIQEQVDTGASERRKMPFKVGQKMPYLQACIKEGMRLQPSSRMPLWRTVNEGGIQLDGAFLPAGSDVGANPYLSQHNRDVWGPNVEEYRPERWIEAREAGEDKLRSLDAHWFPFGLESRTCIGENISNLEMTKILPVMVYNFDFELEQSSWRFSTANYWFVKVLDFNVRVRSRKV